MTTILASCGPGETRVAVVQGGALVDYAIDRPGAPDGVGETHVGRAGRRVPAMAGVFVDLAETQGFLPDSEGGAGLTEGCWVAVRISRAPQGGKGPRLTTRSCEDMSHDGPARLLRRGPGALARLAAAYREAPVSFDDAGLLAQFRPLLGERGRLVGRAFDDALEAEVELLAGPHVDLPGGMRASIVPTPALTAIDIDTGSMTADRAVKSAAQLAANRAVIPQLARQVRLRNLGGAILIDFAGMPVRKRAVLGAALEACLADDPAGPRLIGFTGLGLAEILRPRIHPPLHDMLAGPHAAGLRALRRLLHDSDAAPGRRFALRAAPAVVAALRADPVALPDLARRLAHPVTLISDPVLGDAGCIIEAAQGCG